MQKKIMALLISLVLAAAALTGCVSQTEDTAINNTAAAPETGKAAAAENTPEGSAAALTETGDYISIDMQTAEQEDGTLSHTASLNGREITEYDYTWHSDPAGTYEISEDAPGEYYTGSEPGDDAVYIAHDICYFPEISESGFKKTNYDGETEWVAYYRSDEYKDYIYGTLPVRGNDIPTAMMHSEAEAYENAVLHITKAGTYKLSGTWHGQINIDIGEEAFDDPEAVVTLLLDNADIECTVAPGVIFKSVYECDNKWEETEDHTALVDTSAAGANIIIADGTKNNIYGTNIYRMLKTKFKDDDSKDEVPVQKKLRKNDGALYSYMSLNISGDGEGTGILNVTSENEGIDSELHLTINGGTINIYSQDDGINTNEDNVSVTTINGGDIRIAAGLGYEGDGIDSNGFLVINGGKVISLANPVSDSGLDSDCGSYINGGEVLALGSAMDWADYSDSADSGAVTVNLRFAENIDADKKIEIKDSDGSAILSYSQSRDIRVSAYKRYFTGAIISCPDFKCGSTYTVWIGDKQQCYTGNEAKGFDPGMMPQSREGDVSPEMTEGQKPPQMPDGEQPPQMNDGGQPPQMNDGEQPPQMNDGEQPPQMNDGEQPPQMNDSEQPPQMNDGEQPPQMNDGEQPPQMKNGEQPHQMKNGEQPPKDSKDQQTFEPVSDFLLKDKVNNFSGIKDL